MNEQCYYRISVKALVVDETGRILLAKEDNGKWELLGGGLEHGEYPIAGLRREIKEETGLEITWIADVPSYFITCQRFGADTFMANVIYEVKLKNLHFVASDECQALRFCRVAEARRLDLFPNVTKLLAVFDPKRHILR